MASFGDGRKLAITREFLPLPVAKPGGILQDGPALEPAVTELPESSALHRADGGTSLNKVQPAAGPSQRPLKAALFSPIDIAPLVFFRITFGLLMILDCAGYVLKGELRRKWIEPQFHFTYFGFGWVPTPSAEWLYTLMALLAMAALGVMLGLAYRFSATFFCFGVTWLFLMEQTNYLNHHYLICLVSFLAIFLPANRFFSIDALRRPAIKSQFAPAWTLWLLRAQMGIAYFYGGLAKLNADWLQGEPVRSWFAQRAGTPLGTILNNEFAVLTVSYGGLLFDLLIVPLLLWRKTRLVAFLIAASFHLSNAVIFDIGIFPFLSIALTALFFEPSTHRKVLALLPRRAFPAHWSATPSSADLDHPAFSWRVPVLSFLSLYLACQLLIPFRHFLYPGNVSWTEEGHQFAWHMMLRKKWGHTYFVIVDRDSGNTWRVDPPGLLTERQYWKMAARPELILQFAHHLKRLVIQRGYTNTSIHVIAHVSLNGRSPVLLIDPRTDLIKLRPSLKPATWILPEGNTVTPPRWLEPKNEGLPPPFQRALNSPN